LHRLDELLAAGTSNMFLLPPRLRHPYPELWFDVMTKEPEPNAVVPVQVPASAVLLLNCRVQGTRIVPRPRSDAP
jgi:hypothetical protein